ncbi:hypothetical protein [Rhizobium sp. Leaf386]|uniref:hypothetical protein n=1 Tax=unclassified Rhizobium TaxID=2613769 RepID=UPI000A8C50F9
MQAGYKVEPLSAFLKISAPTPAPTVEFFKPLTAAEEKTSPRFFEQLSFILQFCPTHPSETDLRARFAKLGIGDDKSFDAAALSPELQQAVSDGIADAWAAFQQHKKDFVDTGKASSADSFGTREALKNNYLTRMSGAVLGIYGNSKDEALYPAYLLMQPDNR